MKRITIIILILLFTKALHAQQDSIYKHEIRISAGWYLLSPLWINSGSCFAKLSFDYYYRPFKWFWVGGNFINYFGEPLHYSWREYDINGKFKDFEKSKPKYCAVIAPEIRFSYLNKESLILYSALSWGVGIEDGYDDRRRKYPIIFPRYFQVTYFGFSCNFGKNDNIFFKAR